MRADSLTEHVLIINVNPCTHIYAFGPKLIPSPSFNCVRTLWMASSMSHIQTKGRTPWVFLDTHLFNSIYLIGLHFTDFEYKNGSIYDFAFSSKWQQWKLGFELHRSRKVFRWFSIEFFISFYQFRHYISWMVIVYITFQQDYDKLFDCSVCVLISTTFSLFLSVYLSFICLIGLKCLTKMLVSILAVQFRVLGFQIIISRLKLSKSNIFSQEVVSIRRKLS